MVKAFLDPICQYGGELFGMSQARAKPMERIQAQALRWSFSAPRNCSGVCLFMEAGMLPAHIRWSTARMRGYTRWQQNKTPIKDLIEQPDSLQKKWS